LWLQRVALDLSLPPLAVRVACILTRYVNTRSFEAWPAQPTIANELGVTPRGVRAAVAELVAHGHLKVVVGGGRGNSNRYRPILKTRNAPSGLEARETRNSRAGNPEENGRETRNGCSSDSNEDSIEELIEPFSPLPAGENGGERDDLPPLGGARLEAAPPEEILPPQAVNEKKKNDVDGRAFGDFWRQYPKREGENGARREFAKAVAGGADPKAIITGAMRYAAAVMGKPDHFVAMPVNWLRDGRWKDTPTAPQPEGTNHDGGRPRRKRTALEIAAEYAAKREGR
jgi:hypothetical protein